MKTDGDCELDEMRRPGMKEGLQIDVVHQVGPDANNFSSLFSVAGGQERLADTVEMEPAQRQRRSAPSPLVGEGWGGGS